MSRGVAASTPVCRMFNESDGTFISKDGLIGKSSESSNRSARGEFPGLIAFIIRPLISFIGVYLKINGCQSTENVDSSKKRIHRKFKLTENAEGAKMSIHRKFVITEINDSSKIQMDRKIVSKNLHFEK